MKKFYGVGLVGVALAGSVLLAGVARAETCYRLDPFIDILRLNVESLEDAGNRTHTFAYGNWIASGIYTLPITGARELDVASTKVKRLGVVGTNNVSNTSGAFGSNLVCGLDGYENGPWVLQCAGSTSPFTNSGASLTKINCNGQPVSQPGGRVAGRK